jgi:two-component system NtrC family sensor kinase
MLVRPGQASQDRLTLDGLLGHIRRLRDAAWRKQGIEVELDVRDGATPVYANEHQVTQVLLNLVTNAEQALAGRGASRLALRAWLEGENAVLEVEDNGPGMDPSLLARIWEPFFTTKQGVGTGLGLPLSRSIVDGHGGTLTVDSRPGQGTCFRVSIPRNPVRSAGAAVAAAPSPYRVLVVDDEPNLRKLARRMVEALGHQCDVAEGVADATELAARYEYDLVLCDYRIAAAVADDVVEALVEVAPSLIARTVIATGAISDSGVDDLAGRFGLRVLGKPYGMEEIAGLLGTLDRAA